MLNDGNLKRIACLNDSQVRTVFNFISGYMTDGGCTMDESVKAAMDYFDSKGW